MGDNSLERDEGRVVLVKSLTTNNRFHALVPRTSSIGNAGTVDEIPHDLLLGIAYPCLEDGLNDFAVIRTAYETLDVFDDEEMREELNQIIADARRTLTRRLMEILERVIAGKAHFLGTDLDKFRRSALELIERGCPRHNLDAVMKVNVFASVGETAQQQETPGEDPTFYRYKFHDAKYTEQLTGLTGRSFIISLYADVLDSVLDESNYESKYTFDRYVFQQFIALLFTTYAATDPVFYGTHADDYGVSRDRDMQNTPLYRAVAVELRRIADITGHGSIVPSVLGLSPFSAGESNGVAGSEDSEPVRQERTLHLPDTPRCEDLLLGPIASICAIARHLRQQSRGETAELAQLILADSSRVVQEMKRLGILSPLAGDPGLTEPPPNDEAPNDETPSDETPNGETLDGETPNGEALDAGDAGV